MELLSKFEIAREKNFSYTEQNPKNYTVKIIHRSILLFVNMVMMPKSVKYNYLSLNCKKDHIRANMSTSFPL